MQAQQVATHQDRTARQTLVIILILGALSTVMPLSIDMYLPAFPQIATQMHRSVAEVSWSLSSFFVGVSIGQIFYGPMLDRFGRKTPLYIGLLLYVVASIGCLFSASLPMLIGFRFLQALGACAAQVACMAMVRDFFAPSEGAKIFSILMLILGVSPLFAPTIGGFITAALGWKWVFAVLAIVVLSLIAAIYAWLPPGHTGDKTVSLKPVNIAKNFAAIFKEPQFNTYAIAGACALGVIFTYVAGSPILFMNIYHLSAQVYGLVFAGLAVGFIGASQINIVLSRRYHSSQIFKVFIIAQAVAGVALLVGTAANWYGLTGTIVMLFILLFCTGFTYPNAAAIALAPFNSSTAGSASALLGFLQLGLGALTSGIIGSFDGQHSLPVVIVMAVTPLAGLIWLFIGRKRIVNEIKVGHDSSAVVAH